jgi:hypothetical protein
MNALMSDLLSPDTTGGQRCQAHAGAAWQLMHPDVRISISNPDAQTLVNGKLHCTAMWHGHC